MISTENKTTTLRNARAAATLRLNATALEMLKGGETPKGNALETARAAGLLAAKKTWELIPHCHPLPLDRVEIVFRLGESEVNIEALATAVWKTGVEMEALVAVQTAAAVLFDMLKMADPGMRITNVHVVEKTGGKSDFHESLPSDFKAAVLVTSDGTAAGKREDRSGKVIRERLENFGITDIDYRILPDDVEQIRNALLDFHEKGFLLVLTTGGTGLGPRDVTVQATRAVIDEEIPGIPEAARGFGQARTPYAMLSRGIAGLKGKMLIINLPGSSRGTAESLDAIFPAVLHTYRMMAGGGH